MALWSEVDPPAVVSRIAFSSAAASFVNVCWITTRLSKSMTCATSCGRMRLTNPLAASCAVASLSSMLALVSSRIDSAIGSCVRVKNDRSCFTPSSNTTKSSCVRSVR
jgi:hypothetical protein